MHRILVFSDDVNFTRRLQRAAERRGDFDLTTVDAVNLAVDALSKQDFGAVLVDEAAAELGADERAQLLSAAGQIKPVFAASTTPFDELNDSAHLDATADADQLLDRIDEHLSNLRSSLAARPESGAYFVSDTQGRAFLDNSAGLDSSIGLDTSGGLDRHTSQFEIDRAGAPTVLFVGAACAVREGLEQRAADGDADLLVFDQPRAVSLAPGAVPIDLAVVRVDADLSATRRLVRFLRRRQPASPFEVVLLTSDEHPLQPGLGRTLGADDVLTAPAKPSELIARAAARQHVSVTQVLVVCRRVQRAELFESALCREPIDVAICRPEELGDVFRGQQHGIVLFDAAEADVDALREVEELRRAHPFAPSRFLAVVSAAEREQSEVRRVFDGVLDAPVLPSDIRQLVRLHLAHAGMGRAALERDALTDVNSTLALGDDLEAMLMRAESAEQSVALTGVDVDNLGLINRRYGRAVGDSVLRSLADALHLAAGDRAAIYRTEADEFFILQCTDADAWPKMRDRIDRALHVFRQQTFRSADGRGTYATASAGSVLVPPSRISAEVCLQKCWVVLGRAAATRQEQVLVAQIDPSVLGEVASRDRSDERHR